MDVALLSGLVVGLVLFLRIDAEAAVIGCLIENSVLEGSEYQVLPIWFNCTTMTLLGTTTLMELRNVTVAGQAVVVVDISAILAKARSFFPLVMLGVNVSITNCSVRNGSRLWIRGAPSADADTVWNTSRVSGAHIAVTDSTFEGSVLHVSDEFWRSSLDIARCTFGLNDKPLASPLPVVEEIVGSAVQALLLFMNFSLISCTAAVVNCTLSLTSLPQTGANATAVVGRAAIGIFGVSTTLSDKSTFVLSDIQGNHSVDESAVLDSQPCAINLIQVGSPSTRRLQLLGGNNLIIKDSVLSTTAGSCIFLMIGNWRNTDGAAVVVSVNSSLSMMRLNLTSGNHSTLLFDTPCQLYQSTLLISEVIAISEAVNESTVAFLGLMDGKSKSTYMFNHWEIENYVVRTDRGMTPRAVMIEGGISLGEGSGLLFNNMVLSVEGDVSLFPPITLSVRGGIAVSTGSHVVMSNNSLNNGVVQFIGGLSCFDHSGIVLQHSTAYCARCGITDTPLLTFDDYEPSSQWNATWMLSASSWLMFDAVQLTIDDRAGGRALGAIPPVVAVFAPHGFAVRAYDHSSLIFRQLLLSGGTGLSLFGSSVLRNNASIALDESTFNSDGGPALLFGSDSTTLLLETNSSLRSSFSMFSSQENCSFALNCRVTCSGGSWMLFQSLILTFVSLTLLPLDVSRMKILQMSLVDSSSFAAVGTTLQEVGLPPSVFFLVVQRFEVVDSSRFLIDAFQSTSNENIQFHGSVSVRNSSSLDLRNMDKLSSIALDSVELASQSTFTVRNCIVNSRLRAFNVANITIVDDSIIDVFVVTFDCQAIPSLQAFCVSIGNISLSHNGTLLFNAVSVTHHISLSGFAVYTGAALNLGSSMISLDDRSRVLIRRCELRVTKSAADFTAIPALLLSAIAIGLKNGSLLAFTESVAMGSSIAISLVSFGSIIVANNSSLLFGQSQIGLTSVDEALPAVKFSGVVVNITHNSSLHCDELCMSDNGCIDVGGNVTISTSSSIRMTRLQCGTQTSNRIDFSYASVTVLQQSLLEIRDFNLSTWYRIVFDFITLDASQLSVSNLTCMSTTSPPLWFRSQLLGHFTGSNVTISNVSFQSPPAVSCIQFEGSLKVSDSTLLSVRNCTVTDDTTSLLEVMQDAFITNISMVVIDHVEQLGLGAMIIAYSLLYLAGKSSVSIQNSAAANFVSIVRLHVESESSISLTNISVIPSETTVLVVFGSVFLQRSQLTIRNFRGARVFYSFGVNAIYFASSVNASLGSSISIESTVVYGGPNGASLCFAEEVVLIDSTFTVADSTLSGGFAGLYFGNLFFATSQSNISVVNVTIQAAQGWTMPAMPTLGGIQFGTVHLNDRSGVAIRDSDIIGVSFRGLLWLNTKCFVSIFNVTPNNVFLPTLSALLFLMSHCVMSSESSIVIDTVVVAKSSASFVVFRAIGNVALSSYSTILMNSIFMNISWSRGLVTNNNSAAIAFDGELTLTFSCVFTLSNSSLGVGAVVGGSGISDVNTTSVVAVGRLSAMSAGSFRLVNVNCSNSIGRCLYFADVTMSNGSSLQITGGKGPASVALLESVFGLSNVIEFGVVRIEGHSSMTIDRIAVSNRAEVMIGERSLMLFGNLSVLDGSFAWVTNISVGANKIDFPATAAAHVALAVYSAFGVIGNSHVQFKGISAYGDSYGIELSTIRLVDNSSFEIVDSSVMSYRLASLKVRGNVTLDHSSMTLSNTQITNFFASSAISIGDSQSTALELFNMSRFTVHRCNVTLAEAFPTDSAMTFHASVSLHSESEMNISSCWIVVALTADFTSEIVRLSAIHISRMTLWEGTHLSLTANTMSFATSSLSLPSDSFRCFLLDRTECQVTSQLQTLPLIAVESNVCNSSGALWNGSFALPSAFQSLSSVPLIAAWCNTDGHGRYTLQGIPKKMLALTSIHPLCPVNSSIVVHSQRTLQTHSWSPERSYSAMTVSLTLTQEGPKQEKVTTRSTIAATSSIAVLVAGMPLILVLGPSGGTTAQRAMMQLSIAACSYSLDEGLDIATSPLPIHFGPPTGGYIRGAVVGNMMLMVITSLFAVVGAWLRSHTAHRQGREMTLWRAAASLALPGWLVAPLGFLLQPLTSVSVATVVHSSEGAGASDVALGVFGLVVSAALCGCATWVVTAGFGAAGRPFDRRRWALWLSTSRFPAPVRALFAAVCPTVVWRDAERGSLFVKRYETVFAGKRAGRVWFAAVELWASFATGVIGGVMPPDEATCQRLLIAMCVLQVGFLVLVVALRPYSTPFDRLLSFTSAVVGAVWNIVALVPVDAAALALSAGQIWLSVLSLVLLVAQLLLSGRFARGLRRAESLLLAGVRGLRPSDLPTNSSSDDDQVRSLALCGVQKPLDVDAAEQGSRQGERKTDNGARSIGSNVSMRLSVQRPNSTFPFSFSVATTPCCPNAADRHERLQHLVELCCKRSLRKV